MPRIDIELTSSRPDGTWTWRAAGARQPKGVVAASVLHPGAKVGDVVKAEADFDLDGINVTSVMAPKAKKSTPDLLPILGSGREEALVTHSPLAPEREGGDRGRRGDRGDRGDRDRGGRFGGGSGPGGGGRAGFGPGSTRPRATPGPGDGPRREGPRRDGPAGGDQRDRPRSDRAPGDRPRTERGPGDRPRRDRERPAGERPGGERPRPGERQGGERRGPERRGPAAGAPGRPPRPAAKRLQPGRAHREAALAGLPPEQRPIAEQVLRGGLPGVRQAVDEQNAQARAAGSPQIHAEAILTLAEELLPAMRAAEWRDRAEAAVAAVDEISLRDLRIVAAADGAGRDEESRALVARLREGLERRSAAERQTWTDEITTCLAEGRVVRALRVSSRPPEQGVRLPPELASSLSTAAGDAMSPDAASDRWLAVLEAALTSPVRRSITPRGLPAGADEAARTTIRQAIPKVPALGPLLGEPAGRVAPPPPPRRPPAPPAPPAAPTAEAPAPTADLPAPEAPSAPEAAPTAPEAAGEAEPSMRPELEARPAPVEAEALAPDGPQAAAPRPD